MEAVIKPGSVSERFPPVGSCWSETSPPPRSHSTPLQHKNQMDVGALTFSCSIKPAKLEDLRNKLGR